LEFLWHSLLVDRGFNDGLVDVVGAVVAAVHGCTATLDAGPLAGVAGTVVGGGVRCAFDKSKARSHVSVLGEH
jgi:hypothetical protein